jgi:hypothetical protein
MAIVSTAPLIAAIEASNTSHNHYSQCTGSACDVIQIVLAVLVFAAAVGANIYIRRRNR